MLADMSYIDVFGMEDKEWYTQQAFGDLPGPTTRFSPVGVSAQSNDSFEMWGFPLP